MANDEQTYPDEAPASVLELQRMALRRALLNVDLEAVNSCSSCNTGSCNSHPAAEAR